jgi:4-amino-4-deoxychorismate lyase
MKRKLLRYGHRTKSFCILSFSRVSQIRILFSTSGILKIEPFPVPPVSQNTLYPISLSTPQTLKKLISSANTTSISSNTPPKPWNVHIDTVATPSTMHTSFKTTMRQHYSAARARCIPPSANDMDGKSQMHEVLLFNSADEITEGSITSVYFYRGGKWVTPPVGATPTSFTKISPDNAGHSDRDKTQHLESINDGEGDALPPFAGRWGHSIRSSTSWPDSGGQRGTTRRWALKVGLCMEETVERSSVEEGEVVWLSNGVRGFVVGVVVDSDGSRKAG